MFKNEGRESRMKVQ